jgi:hypothetical protein
MPHVFVTGPCRVSEYWERFEPSIDRGEGRISRTIAAYLARGGNRVLVECTVIEGFHRQVFLVEMIQREEGALVRLFHGSSPEKTAGVRHCLAWVALDLRSQDPSCSWKTENLGIPLPAPFPTRTE